MHNYNLLANSDHVTCKHSFAQKIRTLDRYTITRRWCMWLTVFSIQAGASGPFKKPSGPLGESEGQNRPPTIQLSFPFNHILLRCYTVVFVDLWRPRLRVICHLLLPVKLQCHNHQCLTQIRRGSELVWIEAQVGNATTLKIILTSSKF